MNCMLNPEDLAASLARRMLKKKYHQQRPFQWSAVEQYVAECRAEYQRSQHIVIDFNQVNKLINKEINQYKQHISEDFKSCVKQLSSFLLENNIINQLPQQFVIDTHLNDPREGFIKTLGPQLAPEVKFITSLDQANPDWPYLIRNVVNNEKLLSKCRHSQHPFWFLDTGYTNFLHHKRKIWHRLVKNNIHHGVTKIEYPDDRLHLFPELPRDWRKKGSTILVVESSENHYAMYGTTLEQWRTTVEHRIRKYTDRPIEFRPKAVSRKKRQSVYELLMNSKDYHCVVSDSSAAAVEAVWAGVPVITLRRHITNSVGCQDINYIEKLYRGDIHSWLCMLSYNQFTFEELCNGTALNIMETYGAI